MTSKMAKASKSTEEDITLSAFPDEVLSHILSFVPTKDAVTTSKVSIRWVNIHRSVPVIDLDDYLLAPENGCASSNDPISERFTRIVNKKLISLNLSKIERFRVKCMRVYESSVIRSWICDALSRDVQELEISLKNLWRRTSPTGPVVNSEIFISETLLSLKLSGLVLDVSEIPSLPNLKLMDLRDIIFPSSDDSFRRFFVGCASLEDLSLFQCLLENVDLLDLSSPMLKRLVVNNCEGSYRFLLDNPNLEYLEAYSLSMEGGSVVKNLNSLLEADVRLYPAGLDEIINGLSNVKFLSLKADALDWNFTTFPQFRNLIHLNLFVNSGKRWKFLPILLHQAPNLQQLILDTANLFCCKPYNYEFPILEERPACLSHHLRKIKMENFRCCVCTINVLKYLLLHGEVLENVSIVACSRKQISPDAWSWKVIQESTRSSKSCKLDLQYLRDRLIK